MIFMDLFFYINIRNINGTKQIFIISQLFDNQFLQNVYGFPNIIPRKEEEEKVTERPKKTRKLH